VTKEEFLRSWKLLIVQPWGWRYNRVDQTGKPDADSLTQLDLYFSTLAWAHADAWHKTVLLYVKGKDWPSLGEVSDTLRILNKQFVMAIPDRTVTEYCEAPPGVAEILARLKAKDMPDE
jgi:hypothetical protein